MPSTRVEFPGSQGHALAGRLDTPDGAPRAWALFAHCFTCSKDTKAAAYIARALADAGFGVLRFDFTGLGGSGGDFSNTHFSSNVDDLVAAADWLRTHHGQPALLVGHSLGGAAVLAAAHRITDVRAVATVGAPCDPAHVTHQFGSDLPVIEREGQALVKLAGREFTIRRSFIDDVSGQPQAARIRALRRPLLVLHAPGDKVVKIDNARHLFEAALHPKSFVSLDGADHLLTRAADAQYAAGVIAAWAARYLPEAPESAPSQEVLEHGTVRVSERGTGAFAVSIQAGRHTFVGDEPESVGGDDAGPSPYELLLAALGECTVMTLRMYARQKNWPLANAHVTLTHGKIHASDCADCETKEGKVDRIERVIELIGPLDEAQRARMMEIADRCPVHRTLHAEVTVVTRGAL
jgi:putative redox protein